MGWDGARSWTGPKDVVEAERDNFARSGWTVEAEALVAARHYWTVIRLPDGTRFIGLTLIEKHGKGDEAMWMRKCLSEEVGPCYYDCPLRFLDMVPEATSQYAAGWRAQVRAFHTARARSWSVGERCTIYGKAYNVVGKVKRSYQVQDVATGRIYRATAQKMERAE